jgi:hypothetical protein
MFMELIPVESTTATQEYELDGTTPTGWWYIEVPINPDYMPFEISFTYDTDYSLPAIINSSTDIYVNYDGEVSADRETAILTSATTRIYYYNSEGWTDVYAYAFYGSPEQRPLGDFPGTLATQDSVYPDWWYIEVPVKVYDVLEFTIIFSNNLADPDNDQTPDVIINDETNIYTTYYGEKFPDMSTTENRTTTLYFYNADAWTTVNAYAYFTNTKDEIIELTSAWPGFAAVEDTLNVGWWSVDIPIDVDQAQITIIFNNNASLQTANIYIDVSTIVYVNPLAGVYDNRTDAENNLQTTSRIWFENGVMWDNPTIHIWGGTDVDTDPMPGWPGVAMLYDGVSGWWYYDVLITNVGTFNIVINDGVNPGTSQTANMEGLLRSYDNYLVAYNGMTLYQEILGSDFVPDGR